MESAKSQFDALVALTAPCDSGDCDRDVAWHMDYHGCNQEILCEPHAIGYMSRLLYLIFEYGSAICSQCQRSFTRLPEFLQVRQV